MKNTLTALAITIGLTSATVAQTQNTSNFYFGGAKPSVTQIERKPQKTNSYGWFENNVNNLPWNKPATDEPATQEIAPKLTPEELAEKAKNSLESGDVAGAIDKFQTLLEQNHDTDFTRYALATALASNGDYEKAFNTLQNLYKQEGPLKKVTNNLHGTMALYLAEIAQLNNDSKSADKWLRIFFNEHRDHEEFNRFVRLALTQGWNVEPKPTPADQAPMFRVGVLLPLSGDLAPIGQDLLRAAQLALFDKGTSNLLLYPMDTKGTTEGAKQGLENLLDLGIDLIAGPLLAQNVDAIAPRARAAGLPVIAFSSNINVASPGVYLLNYLPYQQARDMASYSMAQSRTEIGILAPDTPYGHEVTEQFKSSATAMGASITEIAMYNAESSDIGPALTKLLRLEESQKTLDTELKSLEDEYLILAGAMDDVSLTRLHELRKAKPEPIIGFKSLFVPATAKALPLIASQLAFYDIDEADVLLLGTGRWNDKDILKNRAEYLRGGIFPGTPQEGFNEFSESFTKSYGTKPNPVAVLAHDAVSIVSQLLQMHSGNKYSLYKDLTRNEGFNVASGAIRLERDGRNTRGYDILKVTSRTFTQEKAAPKLLPPPLPQPLDPRERRLWSW